MLVLTRKKDESFIIGDLVKVMVVDIRGDKVRLGIEAPKEILVYREEIYNAIKREQEASEVEEASGGSVDGGGQGVEFKDQSVPSDTDSSPPQISG